ncbi:hypothetical protein ERJ71_12840 [Paenibacillus polymyxa]|uniref:Uncharacterized protein n=1 Tax=Paenibacillus polymyxa TaxID=1406 RepID=A0A378XXP7_PAEPO|nr:hypothetical protein [Paenibacillus polymyxa]UOD84096.1 hypothetical protein CUU60_02400 [Paenibacillus polymyxa ATCC 842]WEK67904.1 hypothetical protein ERJ71_12840 [Paenibacillus polymyxa]SUA69802.1 Uncharacterised protein [Paenibacillus polymyxa]
MCAQIHNRKRKKATILYQIGRGLLVWCGALYLKFMTLTVNSQFTDLKHRTLRLDYRQLEKAERGVFILIPHVKPLLFFGSYSELIRQTGPILLIIRAKHGKTGDPLGKASSALDLENMPRLHP